LDNLKMGTTANKYDVKKALKEFYSPSSKDFTVVDVPDLQYIAVDGRGDPNASPDYADAVETLYGVAYTLKFASKTSGRDFVVGPLEGLWRADHPEAFVERRKDDWGWTMMISQPDWITEDMVRTAIEKVIAKKPNPAVDKVRLLTLSEGRSVQILHIGPYDDEAPTLHHLHHQYMPQHGLTFDGDHHEIYLSDPRRTEPAKLKTILRQPVRYRS
jgi:hypothetical protein